MATEQQPDLDPATAALMLQAAVDELTQPGSVKLQRDIPQPGTTAWQLMADDKALQRDLAERLAAAHHTGDQTAAHRASEGLLLLDARRSARTSTTAAVPPLLDQLLDEIPNSGDSGGGRSSGGSRSPLAPAAFDLAREIADYVGAPIGPRLGDAVRAWAADALRFDELLAFRARTATAWPDRVRGVLTPEKRWTAAGRCPDCGNDTAWVDQDGERVRRPAIEFDRSTGKARCLRCPARWDTETKLRTLANALEAARKEEDV